MIKGFTYLLIILVCLSFLVKRDESNLINPYDFKRELLKDAIVNLINNKPIPIIKNLKYGILFIK